MSITQEPFPSGSPHGRGAFDFEIGVSPQTTPTTPVKISCGKPPLFLIVKVHPYGLCINARNNPVGDSTRPPVVSGPKSGARLNAGTDDSPTRQIRRDRHGLSAPMRFELEQG
jgi:hypothetical protein